MNATFLAAEAGTPVGMTEVLLAARIEYGKMERPMTRELEESAARKAATQVRAGRRRCLRVRYRVGWLRVGLRRRASSREACGRSLASQQASQPSLRLASGFQPRLTARAALAERAARQAMPG